MIMRIRIFVLLSAVAVTAIFLFTSVQEVKSSPEPRGGGRGGGGGRSSGGSRGSSSRGSSSRGGGSRYSGGGYKSKSGSSTKSFAQKHWKKAAAFGAGAYVGHKLSNIGGFYRPSIFYYGSNNYNYGYWERNAQIDGWVCRNDADCNWIDPYLGCDDRQFDLSAIRGNWAWKDLLKGRCSCTDGFFFDRNNGTCFSSGLAGWLIAVIVIGVLVGTMVCCCCVCYLIKN